jgi:hypothetical protein
MKYEKPEAVALGPATSVILGCNEKGVTGSDAGQCPTSGHATINAYEADE